MKRYSLIALAALLAFALPSSAFQPPPSLVPYLPANNVVTVTQISSPSPSFDRYAVNLPAGTVLSVTAGTPLTKVQVLGAANLSWMKFKAATLTPPQQVNPIQLQLATIYFMQNIGRPFYSVGLTGPNGP